MRWHCFGVEPRDWYKSVFIFRLRHLIKEMTPRRRNWSLQLATVITWQFYKRTKAGSELAKVETMHRTATVKRTTFLSRRFRCWPAWSVSLWSCSQILVSSRGICLQEMWRRQRGKEVTVSLNLQDLRWGSEGTWGIASFPTSGLRQMQYTFVFLYLWESVQ